MASRPYRPLEIYHDLQGQIDDLAFDDYGRLLAILAHGRELIISDAQTGKHFDASGLRLDPRRVDSMAPIFSDNAKLLAIPDPRRQHLRIFSRDSAQMAMFAKRYLHRDLTNAECSLYLRQPTCPPSP